MPTVTRRSDPSTWGSTTWTLWASEPYDSTPLLRLSLSAHGSPRFGFCLAHSDENGWTLGLHLWRSLYLTLPWAPVPRWLDHRETSIQLDWDRDGRLPSLWLRAAFLSCMMSRSRGLFGMFDLLTIPLGRWDAEKEETDAWKGQLVLPQLAHNVVKPHAVTVTVQKWTARWRRQWWPPVVQWGYTVEAMADDHAWPDYDRPHKGLTYSQSRPLPGECTAAEAARLFATQQEQEAR